jgi:hypothetical protein
MRLEGAALEGHWKWVVVVLRRSGRADRKLAFRISRKKPEHRPRECHNSCKSQPFSPPERSLDKVRAAVACIVPEPSNMGKSELGFQDAAELVCGR